MRVSIFIIAIGSIILSNHVSGVQLPIPIGSYMGYRHSLEFIDISNVHDVKVNSQAVSTKKIGSQFKINAIGFVVGNNAIYKDYYLNAEGVLELPLGKQSNHAFGTWSNHPDSKIFIDYKFNYRILFNYKIGFVFPEATIYGALGYDISNFRVQSHFQSPDTASWKINRTSDVLQSPVLGGGVLIPIDTNSFCTLEILSIRYRTRALPIIQISGNTSVISVITQTATRFSLFFNFIF
ncbi:MAG: hypothetical protein QM538_07300 [Methylacidiphilales bacterium]|nr:hypothetical protein [Candidatus Methylacidiphilales bacterium]